MEEIEVIESSESEPDVGAQISSIDRQIKDIDAKIRSLQSKKVGLQQRKNRLQDDLQKEKSEKLSKQDWETKVYPWSSKLKSLCSSQFQIENLRPQQLPTMNATLSGTHCILIMPTGGGKSLCYQLPALVDTGLTLVVSPLISLMEDQVFSLQSKGVQAAMLAQSTPKEEQKKIYMGLTDPKWPVKLLYVTPERVAKSKTLMSKLQKRYLAKGLSRIAIDEVHCCSQWGHDFRTDYKFLGIMNTTFAGVPILGLTATATSKVISDVQKILNIEGCLVLKASFNRPNLFYEVKPKPCNQEEMVEELVKLLTTKYRNQSGIIYTTTIKESLDLVTELRKKNLNVAPYHGQMEPEARTKVHKKWISNTYQAVVATIAFGMGIDKPDVRFVIHHSVSKSVENFYQESGRAGRDGETADCILFFRFMDIFKQSTMVFTEQTGLEKLYSMLSYCIDATRCRRNILSEHFGERWDDSDCAKNCDHCRELREIKTLDLSSHLEDIKAIIDNADRLQQRLTGQKLVDAWLGKKGPVNLRVKSVKCTLSRVVAETALVHLILDGCLKEDFHFTPYSTISYLVLGPKAEAGFSPTPLEIPGIKKLVPSLSEDECYIEEVKRPEKELSSKNDSKRNKNESSSKENGTKMDKNESSSKSGAKMDKNDSLSNKSGAKMDRNDSLSSKSGAKMDRSESLSNKSGAKMDKNDSLSNKSGAKMDRSESLSNKSGAKTDRNDSLSSKSGRKRDRNESSSNKNGAKRARIVTIDSSSSDDD